MQSFKGVDGRRKTIVFHEHAQACEQRWTTRKSNMWDRYFDRCEESRFRAGLRHPILRARHKKIRTEVLGETPLQTGLEAVELIHAQAAEKSYFSYFQNIDDFDKTIGAVGSLLVPVAALAAIFVPGMGLAGIAGAVLGVSCLAYSVIKISSNATYMQDVGRARMIRIALQVASDIDRNLREGKPLIESLKG
ncbi:MAG TPA: hypothetical protein VJH24_02880 [Candidatus Bilamarchaeaceae archaeon]|nr:hypothetical protein [Candidatus Bilamarchaeaceae archaeon]